LTGVTVGVNESVYESAGKTSADLAASSAVRSSLACTVLMNMPEAERGQTRQRAHSVDRRAQLNSLDDR